MKVGVLVADGFQDSEFFLPKVEFERAGLTIEVISLAKEPVEIYYLFSRIGLLDVQRSIQDARADDYVAVLVPGGAKSPAILSQNEQVLDFLRDVNRRHSLVAPICRGTLLVASSGIVKGRRVTGFHLSDQYPELVVRPAVEQFGGLWQDDQPVVVDDNLISSRHPDDIMHFTGAIREWLTENVQRSPEVEVH